MRIHRKIKGLDFDFRLYKTVSKREIRLVTPALFFNFEFIDRPYCAHINLEGVSKITYTHNWRVSFGFNFFAVGAFISIEKITHNE